ncbi:MAG: tetratricopeptide (TPR) repeat protein [Clostridium sp.]|jgi:tetratricopeptide (TPR) repeat protein
MKTKSLKFKIIAFAILSAIGIGLIVNSTLKNVNIKSSNAIIINSNTELKSNKTAEIKNQELKKLELEKQQQINQKQESLENIWEKGYDQFFQKEYNKAIETEKQVIKEDDTFYKAYAVEGIALAYSGDFKSGIKQIDQALKLKPYYGYARFNKALANELYGHYDEAIKWYNKALEVEKFEWSYYGIASIYGRKGDIENTIKYLKLAIDINPTIKNTANDEEDFNNVREHTEFKQLIEK